jgi:hypothetical protein
MPSAGVKRDNATEEVFLFSTCRRCLQAGLEPQGSSGSVLSRIAKRTSSAAPLPDPGMEDEKMK